MRLFSFILIILLLMCGCFRDVYIPAGFSTTKKSPEFDDVPIPPRHFTYIEARSFSYVMPSVPSFRVAEINLVGDARVDDTADFYNEQMPLFNWKLVGSPVISKVEDRIEMEFRKPETDEVCRIVIWREQQRVYVSIELGVLLE